MRRALLAASALTACWHAPAPPPPAPPAPDAAAEPPPPLRLAVLEQDGDDPPRLLVVALAGGRLAVVRAVAAPAWATEVLWGGDAPTLVGRDDDRMRFQTLAADGLVDVPDVPWTASVDPSMTMVFETERALVADGGAALLRAHCIAEAVRPIDPAPRCTTWQFARVAPPPVTLLAGAPDETPGPAEPTPPVAPPFAVTIDAGGRATCTDAQGRAHALATELGRAPATAVHWLAAEPPIFALVARSYRTATQLFEGCAPARHYRTAAVDPRGAVVLLGSELAVVWRGKLVARAPIVGRRLALAPASLRETRH